MNTITGTQPEPPTNIRVIRERPAPKRPEIIPCTALYAGCDGETHWWAIRTVTDEWILPTDTIDHDPMPYDHAIRGYAAEVQAA